MDRADTVVSVRGLRKSYDQVEAVAGLDLHVSRGEIFGFLGPNGAGKTTTVEILEGFRTRTAGEVTVLGVDPARAGGAWRDRVGVVLQESQPEPGLTVRDCLRLYAGYYSAPRDIAETIGLVGLWRRRPTRSPSGCNSGSPTRASATSSRRRCPPDQSRITRFPSPGVSA
jgi:ABC-2 type transport system ATP-binding protein